MGCFICKQADADFWHGLSVIGGWDTYDVSSEDYRILKAFYNSGHPDIKIIEACGIAGRGEADLCAKAAKILSDRRNDYLDNINARPSCVRDQKAVTTKRIWDYTTQSIQGVTTQHWDPEQGKVAEIQPILKNQHRD